MLRTLKASTRICLKGVVSQVAAYTASPHSGCPALHGRASSVQDVYARRYLDRISAALALLLLTGLEAYRTQAPCVHLPAPLRFMGTTPLPCYSEGSDSYPPAIFQGARRKPAMIGGGSAVTCTWYGKNRRGAVSWSLLAVFGIHNKDELV
jgi:hypothetical protein